MNLQIADQLKGKLQPLTLTVRGSGGYVMLWQGMLWVNKIKVDLSECTPLP